MIVPNVFAIGVLLLSSLSAFAVDAKGFVRPEACRVLDTYRLHLIQIDNRMLNKPVVLMFPGYGAWYSLQNTWQELDGSDCSKLDDCEAIVHAKIKLQDISLHAFIPFRRRRPKSISGEFVVELADGRKIEGCF